MHNAPPGEGERIRRAVVSTAFLMMMASYLVLNDPRAEAQETVNQEASESYLLLQKKKMEAQAMAPEEREALAKQLKGFEKELLRFPEKDRLRFGQDTHYTYDTNPNRLAIHHVEGDSTFKINPFVEIDLGGQRTDASLEYRWDRTYNFIRPASDSFDQQLALRLNRKIHPKTTLTINSRLTRGSVRTTELQGKKINWDNSHRVGLSYDLHPKLSLNLEASYSRSDFPHENFDQDANYSFSLDPNFSFEWTPKTRFTGGYRWNLSRSPLETSDATNHEFRFGYSQKLTPKSSFSFDLTNVFQDPDSAQASKSDQVSTSVSYAWQMTPKTSLRLLYSNSFTHSISDSVSGTSLSKTTSRSVSDTWGVSLRTRLHRKLTVEFSFNPTHSHSKTRQTGSDNTRSRQFTFPFQAASDFDLTKWLRVRVTYTYRHQIGNEHKTDEHRAHTLFVGLNAAF